MRRPFDLCRALGVLALAALVLAACSDDGEGVITEPGAPADDGGDADGAAGGDAGDGAPGQPGGDEGGLVISVEVVGSFGTPESTFRAMPTQVLYEDGATLTQGAVMAIYPGPAVLPLAEGRVEPAEVDRLVGLAVGAGLTGGDLDVGEPPVADVGTTRITVVVDGTEHVTEVPSQGFDDEGPGVSASQAAARAEVAAFLDELSETLVMAETGELFAPDRYRVQAGDPVEADPQIEPNRLEWPLGDLPERGVCTPVTGDDAEELAGLLDQATQITRWTAPGSADEVGLAVRPVLPHEPDC